MNKLNRHNPFLRYLRQIFVLLALFITPAAQATGIVIAGGSLTEIVYALDAGDQISAVDTTSTYPSETEKLKKIGYPRALSTEGILSTHPSLLILNQEAGPPPVIQQIKNSKIPVLILPADYSFEGFLNRIRLISESLPSSDETGKKLIHQLKREWEETKQHINTLKKQYPTKPNVIFILAHRGAPMIAGRDTAANALIHLAGGNNPMSTVFSGYKPMTPEALMTVAPDVLLVTTESLEQIQTHPLLKNHPRIIYMDALKLLGFGPRLPAVVREIAERIYEKPR